MARTGGGSHGSTPPAARIAGRQHAGPEIGSHSVTGAGPGPGRKYPSIWRDGRKANPPWQEARGAGIMSGFCRCWGARPVTDDAVRYVRSGDGQVGHRVVGSGPPVAWVPGTIAGAPPRS